jgi:hypothetical protein
VYYQFAKFLSFLFFRVCLLIYFGKTFIAKAPNRKIEGLMVQLITWAGYFEVVWFSLWLSCSRTSPRLRLRVRFFACGVRVRPGLGVGFGKNFNFGLNFICRKSKMPGRNLPFLAKSFYLVKSITFWSIFVNFGQGLTSHA